MRKVMTTGLVILVAGLLIFPGRAEIKSESGLPKLPPENEPYEYLSSYSFFENAQEQIPAEGVHPYFLNTPHFADYATLRRFLWLPPESKIKCSEEGLLEYPLNTALIISASYPEDIRDVLAPGQLIETRVLIKRENSWESMQYVWDDNQIDARLEKAGGSKAVSWTHYDGAVRSHSYFLPNQNQCRQCHVQNGVFVPLGPMNQANLNKIIDVAESKENQLDRWVRLGLMENFSDEYEKNLSFPVWDDPDSAPLEERARAYLDANCASCHRPDGIAHTSGLDLRFEQRDPAHFGVFKSPVAAGRGVGAARFDIVPGKPEESVLLIRMKSTDPGIRMPIVGRGLAHEEGIALISQWIASLEYPDQTIQQGALDHQKELFVGSNVEVTPIAIPKI